MGAQAPIALYVVLGLYLVAWFAVLVSNAWRLVKVVGLEGEDRADNRGWAVWTGSIASLFLGCVAAVLVWGVLESVLKPLDPYEDSIGTIQLVAKARSNVLFMVVSNLLLGVAAGLIFGLAGPAS